MIKRKNCCRRSERFQVIKNPYEIYCEYREMFEDSENKKSYSTKLRRRSEWVKNTLKM